MTDAAFSIVEISIDLNRLRHRFGRSFYGQRNEIGEFEGAQEPIFHQIARSRLADVLDEWLHGRLLGTENSRIRRAAATDEIRAWVDDPRLRRRLARHDAACRRADRQTWLARRRSGPGCLRAAIVAPSRWIEQVLQFDFKRRRLSHIPK